MLKPSIDELLDKVDSKYRLVHIVAKRAREIEIGRETTIENPISYKSIGHALEELSNDHIAVK